MSCDRTGAAGPERQLGRPRRPTPPAARALPPAAALPLALALLLALGAGSARRAPADDPGVPGGDPVSDSPTPGPEAPAPGEPIRLLFIHHSCGGQLLAAAGARRGGDAESGERCIYESHPNGGDLRRRLEEAGYEVHEASYGSLVGEDTDIHDWRGKFAGRMDRILRTDNQDAVYGDGRRNEVVVFKSCFPNNRFVGPGEEPGDPDAPELTVANARAAYRSLLPLFHEHPEVLFVAVTAPPLAEPRPSGAWERLTWWLRPRDRAGERARRFNGWLADPGQGWLADYDLPNVAVFDYYGILTAGREDGWSAHPTGGGRDSHPSREGNAVAAERFVPFLDAAVDRMWPGRRSVAPGS